MTFGQHLKCPRVAFEYSSINGNGFFVEGDEALIRQLRRARRELCADSHITTVQQSRDAKYCRMVAVFVDVDVLWR